MENATKALLMAGGILVGILILTLLVTLVVSVKKLTYQYNSEKNTEAVAQFNVNFLKYTGRNDLTIHQVITITNFAKEYHVTVIGGKTTQDVNETTLNKQYQLEILKYNAEGYIAKIRIK